MPNKPLILSRVTDGELVDVETVFDDLRGYSTCVDGEDRRVGAAIEFATARPPGARAEDKHPFVAYRDGRPVGLLDVIDGYPIPGTAFIGLLAVRESLHGAGLGRALYEQAETFIRKNLGAGSIRLAVVEANPVHGFWKQMGFVPTGDVPAYEGRTIVSRLIMMEKSVCPVSD